MKPRNTDFHDLILRAMTTLDINKVFSAIQQALNNGADINATDANGSTPLKMLVSRTDTFENYEVIYYMLQRGALVTDAVLGIVKTYQSIYRRNNNYQSICRLIECFYKLQHTDSLTISLASLYAAQSELSKLRQTKKDDKNSNNNNETDTFPSLKQLAMIRVGNLVREGKVDPTKLPIDIVQQAEGIEFPKATALFKQSPKIISIGFECQKIKSAMQKIVKVQLKHLEIDIVAFALKIQILAGDLIKKINFVYYNKGYSVDIKQQIILGILNGMAKGIMKEAKSMGCIDRVKDLAVNSLSDQDNSITSIAEKLVDSMQKIMNLANVEADAEEAVQAHLKNKTPGCSVM